MSLTQADLAQFTGTEQFWYQSLISFKYTDVSAFQHQPAIVEYVKRDWFQTWKLCVKDDQSATLTCGDGNGNILFTHTYDYTDFPLSEITFYLVDGILLLPSEY